MAKKLADLVIPGRIFAIKATPKASRDRIVTDDSTIRVYVTAPADKGKANEAIRKLLAKALGVPKTRLTLVRGDTSRDKQFRLDP